MKDASASTKYKTKFDKHLNDNEKRRRALNEKAKAKSNQTEIIKQALSTASLHYNNSKKIVFDDDDDDDNCGNGCDSSTNDHTNSAKLNGTKEKKPTLFDEGSSGDEEFHIKEKAQFAGKKGFELLKLQASYGNDERFKIDERFLDENEQDTTTANSIKLDGENEQLEDENNATGKSETSRKSKKRNYEMIRYDATNKDHEKYEVKQQKLESDKLSGKRKKKERKFDKAEKKPKVEVSSEKFFEVSKDIKESFSTKAEKSNSGFSLLKTYGQGDDDGEDGGENEDSGEDDGNEELLGSDSIECPEYNGSNEEAEQKTSKFDNTSESKTRESKEGTETQGNVAIAKGIWKETFFFSENDPRLREGLDFINKKNSKEAETAAENYDATRKKLREILRLRNKKQLMKKNPFRNKVGGMNKKQLTNQKFKNGSKIFQKKTLSKVNSRAKF